jgi:hypothetical protein
MFKKLLILSGALVIFLAGCGSDGDSNSSKAEEEPTAVAAQTAEPTEVSKPVGGPSDLFQPLSLMGGPLFGGGFDMEAATQEVDPGLEAVLITKDDLPADYASFGDSDLSFAFDTPEGHMEMAVRMFFGGEMMEGGEGPVVMSGAISMPAAAFEEWDASLAELENIDREEILEAMGETGMEGVEFSELELSRLDLGEGGVRMHMVMDMSGFAATLGEGTGAYEGGIAFDMYMFREGEVAYMLMSMWPADQQADVDGLALARLMESRAG